jgi:hypothetical protein
MKFVFLKGVNYLASGSSSRPCPYKYSPQIQIPMSSEYNSSKVFAVGRNESSQGSLISLRAHREQHSSEWSWKSSPEEQHKYRSIARRRGLAYLLSGSAVDW